MASNDRVHLVGSVTKDWSVEEVFRNCAQALGGYASKLPDGEVGDRFYWINFLAYRTYFPHPDMEPVQRPREVPGKDWWVPTSYDEHWHFRIKDDVPSLRFEHLGYARAAKESYAVFRRLRDQGVIPAGTRFQVAVPLTESGTRQFVGRKRDFELMWDAYQDAMRREIATLVRDIPPRDLAFQWDICGEVAAVEGVPWGYFKDDSDPMERYTRSLADLSPSVPKEAQIGFHLCYGDLAHKHFMQPKDLGVCVRMANEGVKAAGRSVEFIHMPVPRDRADDAYFAPLGDLRTPGSRVFLGLVHHTDGLDGTLGRLNTAKRHLKDFGISTECGLARRPAETLAEVFRIHREAADKI
ncbi:MAG: hypothetical protein AB7N53_18430 [Candidatus Binatia bacterium]